MVTLCFALDEFLREETELALLSLLAREEPLSLLVLAKGARGEGPLHPLSLLVLDEPSQLLSLLALDEPEHNDAVAVIGVLGAGIVVSVAGVDVREVVGEDDRLDTR
jgi:hypothetical protein